VDEFEQTPPMTRDISNEELATKVIVAFFADGSEKYTNMTIHAIKTFLENTPLVRAGVLTHTDDVKDRIYRDIPGIYHERIVHRKTSSTPYFANWNPTQYKLDIQKFADQFETIFWMDSDSIVIGDMTDFLLDFARSDEALFFVPDHVMSQEDFCARWRKQRPLTLIPQACLMGFKAERIQNFFKVWASVWEEWITPFPFANYEDPNPSFPGSAFCIEQYALAIAISYFPQLSIRTFAREYLVVAPFVEQPGQALILQSQHNAADGSKRTQPFEYRSLGVFPVPFTVNNLVSYPFGSFSGSFATLKFSFPLTSFGGSFTSGGFSGGFTSGSFQWLNQSFGSLTISPTSYQTVSGSWLSLPGDFSNSNLSTSGGWFIDRFGGSVIHTYNQFYPAVRDMDLSRLASPLTPSSVYDDPPAL